MDPFESAPQIAAVTEANALPLNGPQSTPITNLPIFISGNEQFNSIESVMTRVRELHEVLDPDVAPHRSKYAARIIMTDILALLKHLLNSIDHPPSEKQWLTEQIGRIEYLNGINHIEAEETSAGEKMLAKAMIKFKDNAVKYPFDVIDGYNHLAVVWSNRTQHGLAHAYLQVGQQAFLRFKKLRQSAIEGLTDDEKSRLAKEDRRCQMEEAVDVELERMNITEKKTDDADKEESKTGDVELKTESPLTFSTPVTHPGYQFLDPAFWHRLETTHTMTLFFLAQVFGHMKKRDLAAVYCHLTLNRQLKQRKDFQRIDWVTNAIGLSFYYSGRKLFQQAHHCLLAAQSFIKDSDIPKKMNTPTTDTTRDQQLAADLCRAWGAFYLKWLQRSRDLYIESDSMPTPSYAANTPSDDAVNAAIKAAAGSAMSVAGTKDDLGDIDPTSSLTSLPPEEWAEMKRLQRIDREHERHFENKIEEEADEEEDELFGDLNKARKMKTKEQLEEEVKNPKPVDRTMPSSLTPEEQEAVNEELKKNDEEDSEEATISTTSVMGNALPATAAPSADATTASATENASASAPTPATSSSSSSSPSSCTPAGSTHLFIEFKSLKLPPSPVCVPATTFVAARSLFKLSLEWFTRASWFYILDGYVSDHIPIQQDISLLYKLLAIFDIDLSRQCKMHKRRIDLLTPIYKQLSVASYQEFYQQLTDEIATTYSEMMELKQYILTLKIRLLGKKFPEKKREDAQQKINELALQSIQHYQIWLQSWSKDGKPVETLDPYYHRWYLMAMFKIARCYSKIYHDDPQILNQFTKKAYDQYRLVIATALNWDAVHVMPEELTLCKEMVDLLPHKMDRISAKGSFK